MGSNKILLLLGLSLVILFVITSEVTARDLAETEYYSGHGGGYQNGGGGPYNGGGGPYNGGGGPYNGARGYTPVGGYGGGSYGRGCPHGYCSYRCCNYAGEVVEAEATQAKPQN